MPLDPPDDTFLDPTLRQIADLAAAGARFNGGASTDSFQVVQGPAQPESFWAKVTGNDGGTPPKHSWVQQLEDPATAVFADMPDGMSGTAAALPLYEVSGGTITTGDVVRTWRGTGEFYLGACCQGSGTGSDVLTVETIDGTTTVLSNISPPLVKVGPGLNLQGVGGGSGHAQLDLCGAYLYGTMSGGWGSLASPQSVPSGSGFAFGSGSSVFGSSGGNVTWATAGTYLASFHTQLSFTATGANASQFYATLAFSGNFSAGPPNDTAGTSAESWFGATAYSPTGSTSGSLYVSVVQFVHVTTAGTAVQIFGTAGGVWTGTPGVGITSSAGNPYSLWALRLG